MKAILGVAGLLGLIALAFGEAAAAMVARIFIYAALALAGLILLDIVSHGALSNLI